VKASIFLLFVCHDLACWLQQLESSVLRLGISLGFQREILWVFSLVNQWHNYLMSSLIPSFIKVIHM
jgi:hypothetical protein